MYRYRDTCLPTQEFHINKKPEDIILTQGTFKVKNNTKRQNQNQIKTNQQINKQ